MGAAGGAAGGSGGIPNMDYKGRGGGASFMNNPNYMLVGYGDESNGMVNMGGQMLNNTPQGIYRPRDVAERQMTTIQQTAEQYGWKGLEDLVRNNPTDYYDPAKYMLQDYKRLEDLGQNMSAPWYDKIKADLGDKWTSGAWKGDNQLFNSYDIAVKQKQDMIDKNAPSSDTTAAPKPVTTGPGGDVGDGSLLTSADKEKKRQASLVSTSGPLTLGNTTLLGG